MALHIGIGNFSGGMCIYAKLLVWSCAQAVCLAIASNIYRSQDAPRYILGRTCWRGMLRSNTFLIIALRWPRTHVCWHWLYHCAYCCRRVYSDQRQTGRDTEKYAGKGNQAQSRGDSRAWRSCAGFQVYAVTSGWIHGCNIYWSLNLKKRYIDCYSDALSTIINQIRFHSSPPRHEP